MSKPEPFPKNEGIPVTEELIKWMTDLDIQKEVIELVQQRNEFGMKKYGQPLMSQDGRNSIEDARQELGDALQYIYKAKINGEDYMSLEPLIKVLNLLLLKPI